MRIEWSYHESRSVELANRRLGRRMTDKRERGGLTYTGAQAVKPGRDDV